MVQSLSVDVNGTKHKASSSDGLQWVVMIPGLDVDNEYEMNVYPNNLHMGKTETISVKRKGLVVDDDF